jgi:LmbE family N-acetylglucosaminyl deacetylase
MRTHYDAIYLSPHLDDAALSCGGQIYRQAKEGGRVLIVTIMAGDPPPDVVLSDFARSLHGRWELAESAEAARRREDEAAAQTLGAEIRHWRVPDCIYRAHPQRGEPLYPTWPAVIDAIHPAETALITQLAEQMAALPAADRVVAPLGAGRHVDHQITRLAAETCFGGRLWYYEDYPYVRDIEALTAVIPPNDPHWQAITIPLQADDVAAKIEAIAAYTSQLSTFFTDRDDLVQKIEEFTDLTGGERLWQQQG